MVQQDIVETTVIKEQETESWQERFLYLKHNDYHVSTGIAGILTVPTSLKFESVAEKTVQDAQYGFPLHKLVLLCHGHSAHKNTVYMPLLARKLADMGYYVLRIDFRSMGDSEPNRDATVGRTIAQDCEDIETVYQWAASQQCRQLVGHTLVLDTIVAHSRGVMSMFEFARSRFVPNLVNACGRFVAHGLFEKSLRRNPNWDRDGGFWCTILRYGKMREVWIPKAETMSAATVDTSKFAEINARSSVLSIYGSNDTVIPLTALAQYSNLFEGRHTAELVMYADHNFYGLPGDKNANNLPLRKGLVNYNVTTVDRIASFLAPEQQLQRFYKATLSITDSWNSSRTFARWCLPYEFSHVSNFRDVGGHKTCDGRRVKPRVLFRCANPVDITEEGFCYLTEELKVSQVFDLRSAKEVKEPGAITGVPVINLPFNNQQSAAPQNMSSVYRGMFLSPYTFPQAYMVMLQNSTAAIAQFFRYIVEGRCNRSHAAVIHCAGGKDRTGILTMLVLGLLGVDDDTIARDYELTTIGLKTAHKLLKALEDRGDAYYELLNSEKLAKEFQATPESMCRTVISSKYEAMRLFLDQFRANYGSFEQYFLATIKLSAQDLSDLKNALLE
ncbi:LAME_0F07206g1_1 [Lachancea meyersii CBS 8951]|uniref:LAME_0F07206g1_1 n=1 Tax=Lachancea meyersii CBS 8951 TaxID=1266667 RepID=A0A1G4JUA6_9SACH|nr:LAME_0F07206g1_1 [Lachancea meyersii CBS 8951]